MQVVAISNLKPAVAAVPAQAIQAPSAQNVLAGFQLFVCIGSLRLGQRPTWDLSPSDKFNSTLGYPGEGPVLNAGASMPMNVDVQAVVSNLPTPATPEAARGPSVGSNTAISPLPVIDAAEEAKIANTVGLAAFESLWDEMACKISGNRSAGYKLNLKCNCATKREQISFRVPVGEGSTWADVCGALKKRVLEELHCGEKCTPTLLANKNPPTKRPHADNWLGQATAEKKKRQEEAAHSTAVADSERKATDLVQEIAKLQAEIKHLQDDLKKHKADPDRLKMPINQDNNDGFDHERRVEDSLDADDAGTDDDEGDSKAATPAKTQKGWWQLIRTGQIFKLKQTDVQCKVLRVEGAAAEWSVTVQILEGDSKDECVHGLKWWHLVYKGQKFRRNGHECAVTAITFGTDPSLQVHFADGSNDGIGRFLDTEFTSLEPWESAEEIQAKLASKLRQRKYRTFRHVIRDPRHGMLSWLQYHAQGSSRRAALIVEALVNALPERCQGEIRRSRTR